MAYVYVRLAIHVYQLPLVATDGIRVRTMVPGTYVCTRIRTMVRVLRTSGTNYGTRVHCNVPYVRT